MESGRRDRDAKPAAAAGESTPAARKKLSYLEQREWDGIEARILEAEHGYAVVEKVGTAGIEAERLDPRGRSST